MHLHLNLRHLIAVSLLVAFAGAPAWAAGANWTTDYEAAKAEAAKTDRDLLLDFTGSDWCGWCIKLKEEVFSQPAFQQQAPKHFVLVELDFPRGKQQTAEVKAQNERLQSELGVQGFPTIYLVDAEGRPYARTGYRPDGADAYVEHLTQLRQVRATRDELLKQAEAAEGAEKARLLDQALETIQQAGISPAAYPQVMQQIVAADPNNEAGLKSKYAMVLALGEAEAAMQERNFAEAVQKIDAVVKEHAPEGESLQRILFMKAIAQFHSENRDGAVTSLKSALAAAPQSELAPQIQGALQQLGAQ